MPKRILIVDDEPEILELLEGWLSHLKYEILTAQTGDEGLWRIKYERPNLVILDALIPGRTGYQVVRELKAQSDGLDRIPVIIISGRPSMQPLTGEVFAFIAKPFHPRELLAKIRLALEES